MNERVLVVEDDADLLSALCEVLTGFGFEVDGVRGKAEARARLGQRAPDVMLLDLVLDGEPCEDFLEALADNANAPPVVLCSAAHTEGGEISSRYAVSFVAKPFDIHRLLDAIDEAHRMNLRPSLRSLLASAAQR
ncbi:MAG: response regulator [Polyangiales bacterium]